MRRLMLCLIFISISVCPSLAFTSDKNSIFLDGKEIKLGASTNEVRSLFSEDKSYIISESPTSWGISTNLSGDNPRWVGIINFEKGRVKSVTKQWNDYYVETGGLKSFQSLFGLLSNLTKEGYKVAQISTGRIKQPNLSADVILLTMGNRTVTISIENNPDISNRISIKIDEMLSK
jgi:hypothetical protein